MPPKAQPKDRDITNFSPIFNEMAIRDEKLLDALQLARFILSSNDVLLGPSARLERAKLAIEEAMQLMKPLRW